MHYLPEGVASNQDIGAPIKLCKNPSCKRVAAATAPTDKVNCDPKYLAINQIEKTSVSYTSVPFEGLVLGVIAVVPHVSDHRTVVPHAS